MRALLAKAVTKAFLRRLREASPEFIEAKGENIPPGTRLFLWQPSPDLGFYLLLQFHQSLDWFTLEIAVSRSGRWPAYERVSDSPDSDLNSADYRFRMGRLWASAQTDVWWQLAPRPPASAGIDAYMHPAPVPELLPKVAPLVEDAVRRFTMHAVPYLRKIARPHSTECSDP